jgi:cytochrome c-type biogenesis protein
VLSLPLAFLAGILTILSPCVLPLAPIVIAGARARDARGPLALALGLSLAFGVGGGLLASLGIEFGAADWVRVVSAALLLGVGIVMIVPALSGASERWLAPVSNFAEALQSRLPAAGIAGQAATGMVLAFAWAPCAGPTLGAAFALAANGGSLLAAMTIMTAFALGAAGSLLIAGYGLGRIAASGRRIAGWTSAFGRATLGVAFVFVGAAILSGADHAIETAFILAMPDWLVSFATQL